MYRSLSHRFFWFSVKASVGVVTVFAGVFYARWLMTVDPFQRYRKPSQGQLGDNIAMRLGDVMVYSYDGDRLVAKAFVKNVNIQSDRQNLELSGVENGVMFGKQGRVNFSAKKAFYKAFQGVLQVQEGARVYNKDMDLTLDGFVYSEKLAKLRSIGGITGKLMGGQVQALDLEYFADTGEYRTGPLTWEGLLSSAVDIQSTTSTQGDSGAQRSKWTVKSDGSYSQKGDIVTYEKVWATDGEVIVKAPKVELNRKTDVLTATGRVFYFSAQANLICDKVVVYRKEKRALLTGKVTMLIKPKDKEKLEEVELKPFEPQVPDQIKSTRPAPPKQDQETNPSQDTGTLRKYPISVYADQIEYWYGKGNRKANILGRPQARQDLPDGEWRHVWCVKAYYDGEAEWLKLESSEGKKEVHVKSAVGDDALADWFKVSTKEDEEDNWEGWGVVGDFYPKSDELPAKRGGGSTGGGDGTVKPPLKGNIGGNEPGKKGGN